MTVPKTGVLPITPWTITFKSGAKLQQSLTSTNVFRKNFKKKFRKGLNLYKKMNYISILITKFAVIGKINIHVF